MSSWIGALVFMLVVLALYFIMGRRQAEGFNDFRQLQTQFGDFENKYFHNQVDKGVLTNPGLNLAGLNDATAQPDLYLSKTPAADMTQFFVEDRENAFTEEDRKLCRGASHPRDLPSRKPGDRIGCGWYFYENPEKMSVGVLGTRDGPIFTEGLVGGEWIWNREEAIKREDIKRCKMLSRCELLEVGDLFRECGFCPDKGHGIPILSNGTPKYQDQVCGSRIITKTADCFAPEEEEEVEETDEEGNVVKRTRVMSGGRGDWCVSGGIVGKACMERILTFSGFSGQGGLQQLVYTETKTAMMTSALKKLGEFGIAIPDGFWKKRDLPTIVATLPTLNQIAALSRMGDKSLESRAALFLVDGSPYSPCETYTPAKRGPFEADCLQQAFRKAGCQAGGAANPNNRSQVLATANMTWEQVNAQFKKTYNDMKSTDPRTQDMALKNCLGAGSEFAREKGQTCWKCDDWNGRNFTPMRRNADGDIECMSPNGRDCIWRGTKEACDAITAAPPAVVQPLTCGKDHQRKWGVTGYDQPTHWCATASKNGKHDGPLASSWVDIAAKGEWKIIPGSLSFISIGEDDTLWGTNADTRVFRGVSPLSAQWASMPGLGFQIDSKSKNNAVIIGTNGTRGGFGVYSWINSNWRDYPGVGGKWVSVGSDDTVYIVNDRGALSQFVRGSEWKLARNGVSIVSVGNKDNVWIVDLSDNVFMKRGNEWIQVPGKLKRVAVSADGSKVAGLNASGEIFVWQGASWKKIPGNLKNISINNTYIVGTNNSGVIYYLKHT